MNDLIGYLNKDKEQVAESKGKASELLFQSLNKLPEAQYARINEKLVLSHVLEAEFQTIDFTNGPSVAHQLKEMIKILGLQLEYALINLSGDDMADFPKDLETLKPLLLKLLNEQIPASIKGDGRTSPESDNCATDPFTGKRADSEFTPTLPINLVLLKRI